MMLLCAGLTALISVNGAVAALLPMVVVMAVRLGRAPSQLLMPLAFAAHAGSMLALTGTPVNVIVSEAAEDAGLGQFGFFEFALVGVPLLVGTIAIVVLFGQRLLPTRTPQSIPADLSEHAAHAPAAVHAARPGADGTTPDALVNRDYGVAEVVIPPRSRADRHDGVPGDGHRERRPRRAGGAAPGARTPVRAAPARGRRHAAAAGHLGGARPTDLDDPDVLVVDEPELVRRQAVPLGAAPSERSPCCRRWWCCSPPALCRRWWPGLLAAGALVADRRARPSTQAYRAHLVDHGRSWSGR